MENSDFQEGISLIRNDLQLDESSLNVESQEALLRNLTNIVDYLIGHDFQRLLQALYRIDVSEERLKNALAENQENSAEVIAEMIIERELQKVEFRKKYRNWS